LGRPGKAARASRRPEASSRGCGEPKTCFWKSEPISRSELARVTMRAPEMEIMRAGMTVTRPSPMVRTV